MKRKLNLALQTAAILAAGVWVFWPALSGGWVWDDAAEVAQNPVLRDPAGLAKAWVAPAGPDYFPLKTSVQWVEWRLWGADPLGYHLVSLALHLVSALLFWRLLVMLRRDPAPAVRLEWLGGLLFAIHPLAVESVAWITELKNTLSLPLVLAAMIAYLEWDKGSCFGKSHRSLLRCDFPKHDPFYLLSLGAFVLALLAKSTVVMFPCVLLLYLWWRRKKITGKDLVATLPFFGVALVLGLVTVWFQGHRAIMGADLAIGGLGSRLAGAGLALAFYFGKYLLPLGLMPLYPRWAVVPPSPAQFWPWLALGILTAWLWTQRAGWGRGALFGLGCFVLNLLPVLGLVPMAYLRISWVADHFAYLPMLGLIGLAVGGATALADRLWRTRRGWLVPLTAAVAMVLGALGGISRVRAATYRDDATFWTYALERNPQAWLAQNDLGEILTAEGRLPEAIGHLEAALRLKPDYPEAHDNLGNALARSGRLPEAMGEFVAALRLEPDYIVARDNLASLLVQSGRYPEAIDQYEQILRLRPGLAEAHASLGYGLAAAGRLPEAIAQYGEALRLRPGDPRTHNGLGVALARSGDLSKAQAEFEAAVRLEPGYGEARENLMRVRALEITGAGR